MGAELVRLVRRARDRWARRRNRLLAARLARIAATGLSPAEVCPPAKRLRTFSPDKALVDAYAERFAVWSRLYPAIKAAQAG